MKKLLFLFAAIFLIFCSSEPETFTEEIIDGVRHVHNLAPAWGDEPEVELEFVRKIGGLENEDENYQFFRMSNVELDSEGHIYLMDHGNNRIQKFNSDGEYIATIGSKGQGPGEFNFPTYLQIDDKDNLYVGDNMIVKVLNKSGEEIKQIKYDTFWEYFILLNSGDLLFGIPSSETIKYRTGTIDITKLPLMYIMDQKGEIISKFGKMHDYGDGRFTYFGNHIEMICDKDDNIYLAHAYQNWLEMYTPDGKLIYHSDRTLNYELKTEERTRVLGDREYTFPEFTRVTSSIGIDLNNRIWLKTYKKQAEEGEEETDYLEFQIFSAEGVMLTKVAVPARGTTYIHGERIFFVDNREEVCVFEYRIVEK